MFGNDNVTKKGNYQQISLDEFSDDDSDHDDLTPPSQRSRPGSTNGSTNGSLHSNGKNPDVDDSLGRQQMLLKQQDEGLEMLSQSAERLGAMSLQINDEIGFQNKMLDEMESDLERADQDLDMVTRQTKKFIEMSGGTKNCVIIASLALVVVVLLILLIYF